MIFLAVIIVLVVNICLFWNMHRDYNEYVAYDLRFSFGEISTSLHVSKGKILEVIAGESVSLEEIEYLIYMNRSVNYSIDTILNDKCTILFGDDGEMSQLVTFQIDNIYNSIKEQMLDSSSNDKILVTESQIDDFSIVLMIFDDLLILLDNDENVGKNNFREVLNEIYTIQEHKYRRLN